MSEDIEKAVNQAYHKGWGDGVQSAEIGIAARMRRMEDELVRLRQKVTENRLPHSSPASRLALAEAHPDPAARDELRAAVGWGRNEPPGEYAGQTEAQDQGRS